MKLNRVMIAAPKSGSGKTMITCALLQLLKNEKERVVSYKCGPDYIDPMFHKKVIGIPSKNLDTFFTNEECTKELFIKGRMESDFAVLEGVMGLFDGLGGIREEGSSYHLAKVTKTPVILVVDAKGMGRSVISLIAGFLAYDTERLIKGVILNRMSKGYFDILKPIIEEELKIQALGYVPEYKEFHIESRHLGLVMPQEIEDIKEQIQKFSEELEKTVSLKAIRQIAEGAMELPNPMQHKEADFDREDMPVIAVAYDEAFCFYYEDNLRMLEENGAKLQYFSPIHDKELPKACNGILLGGGYPELYGKELSDNRSMCENIKRTIEAGVPVVAECGGFMYLHSAITNKENNRYEMVGAIPGECYYTGKLVRFGYIELQERKSNFILKGEKIRGHEFHYFDSTNNGEGALAVKPVTGKNYSCVMIGENYWLGFPHLYYPSNPSFPKHFVEKARDYIG